MNEKNLPYDIQLKSLEELTSLANKIIENLERKRPRKFYRWISKTLKIKYFNSKKISNKF